MVDAIVWFGWTFIILIFITVLYSMINGGK
jgi:hypothetical protein